MQNSRMGRKALMLSGSYPLYEYALSIVLTVPVTIVVFFIEPVIGHAAAHRYNIPHRSEGC